MSKFFTKIFPMAAIGTILSFFTFLLFRKVIESLDFGDFTFVLILLSTFLIVLTTEVFFIEKFKHLFWVSFVQLSTPLIVFRDYFFTEFQFLPVLGIVIFLYFSIWSVRRGYKTLKNSINIEFFVVARRVTPRVVSGALIFFAIFSYFHFFQLGNFSNETAENIFDKTLNASTPILQIWFSDVTFDMTVDEALREMSETQVNRSQIDLLQQGINLDQLPVTFRENLINETSIKIKESVEAVTGTLDGNQSLRDALFQVVSGKVADLSNAAKLIISVLVISLIFMVFKGIAWLVYLPAEIISFLLFELLLLTGFGKLATENLTREVITI
ncbi:MAG: hypothetical protein WDZ80_06035 [Candidatus Paceibacterota bacterium]